MCRDGDFRGGQQMSGGQITGHVADKARQAPLGCGCYGNSCCWSRQRPTSQVHPATHDSLRRLLSSQTERRLQLRQIHRLTDIAPQTTAISDAGGGVSCRFFVSDRIAAEPWESVFWTIAQSLHSNDACCTSSWRSVAWNSLPDFIRDPTSSTDCFRRLLKTYVRALLVHPAH